MSTPTANADTQAAAHLVLVPGLGLLNPETSVLDGMVQGWEIQQHVRFLKADTIRRRTSVVRRMVDFSNLYPWQWTAPEIEAFITSLTSGESPIVSSTARSYTGDLRMFLEYLTDGRYGWQKACLERFGEAPRQVLDEWNTVVHASDYEGRPGRRPLTYDEVQQLFDAADDRVDRARAQKKKGVLSAHRDAVILKTVYAFGLRRREAWGLDLADLRHNPKVPDFGQFGALMVRWGKSSRGGQPRRRTVMLVPEMDWVVPVLRHWLDEVRPGFDPGKHPALWVTERRGRLDWRGINTAFAEARNAAGLDSALDLHCLRHSFVTHLVEFDYPERFVQEQVGHAYASTTAIYTGVSDAYRNTLLRRAIAAHQPDLWPIDGKDSR